MQDSFQKHRRNGSDTDSRLIRLGKRWRCAVIHCLLYLSLSGAAVTLHAASKPLTKSEEGQVYDQAIHILGGNANVISKWVGDVRFTVIGNTSTDSTALAHTTLADVGAQTGLTLVPVTHSFTTPKQYLEAVQQSPRFQLAACSANTNDASECANFVIVFADRDSMQALSKAIPLRPVYQRSFESNQEIPCFFAPFQTRAMVINQAFVYVNNELPRAMIKTCLQEEIYQSFGLFNDYSDSRFFSFNNKVEPKSITLYDRALLASVYDEQISPGAPVWRVMERLMDNLGIDPFSK